MNMDIRIEGLRNQLNAARVVLTKIPDDILVKPVPLKGFGTIGEQFRHIINYCQVLLRDYEKGTINFNDRDRDALLESDRVEINRALVDLTARVGVFLNQDPSLGLRSIFIPVAEKPPVEDGKDLGDAIDYVTDHSYHHIAAIKLIAYIQGIEMDDESGIAPATIVDRGLVIDN